MPGFDDPGVGFDDAGTGFDDGADNGGDSDGEVVSMAVGPGAVAQELFRATPPPISLLTVPGVVVAENEKQTMGLLGTNGAQRWLNGISVEPEACSVSLDLDTAEADFPYWWTCPPGDGTDAATATDDLGGVKAIGDNPDAVLAEPYTAWVGFTCRPVSDARRQAEIDARIRRKLAACLPAIVEHELWTGQVAQLMGTDTPYLADPATATDVGGYFGFVTALAEVEQALADCSCSGRHIIHAQRRVVSAWRMHNLVSLAPTRDHLLTEMGTIVVAGNGYPGTSPQGSDPSYSNSWVYGTGMVRVFLGGVDVATTDLSTVDRSTNVAELRAEQPALAVFSPCCHVAAHVNLCDQLCGGGS